MSKKTVMMMGVCGLVLAASSVKNVSASHRGPGYQCTAFASNGVGRSGQTYWGDVSSTMASAQDNAVKTCNMSTSHGPCSLSACWLNK